jgi:hypothetical protein
MPSVGVSIYATPFCRLSPTGINAFLAVPKTICAASATISVDHSAILIAIVASRAGGRPVVVIIVVVSGTDVDTYTLRGSRAAQRRRCNGHSRDKGSEFHSDLLDKALFTNWQGDLTFLGCSNNGC